jgi:hypothetical protein
MSDTSGVDPDLPQPDRVTLPPPASCGTVIAVAPTDESPQPVLETLPPAAPVDPGWDDAAPSDSPPSDPPADAGQTQNQESAQ